MSRILDALSAIDTECDVIEAGLWGEVAALRTRNREFVDLLDQAMSLSSRRNLAIGLMLAHLQAQGMTREDVDKLTIGSLNLGEVVNDG